MRFLNSTMVISLTAVLVSALSLALSLVTYLHAARNRREDLQLQEQRFRQQYDPVLMVRPQFLLSPGDNKLVAEVTNLHSSVAITSLHIRVASLVKFDDKVEEQLAEGKLAILKPGAS